MSSILLATAALARRSPTWFTQPNKDWMKLVIASASVALVVETAAVFIGLALFNDLRLALHLLVIAPVAFCFVQSIVTDVNYYRADAVALTLASVLVMLQTIVVDPKWGLLLLVMMSVSYLTLRSDGLAIALLLASFVSVAPSVASFAIVTCTSVVITAIASSIFAMTLKKNNRNLRLPMVPFILGSAIIGIAFLVGYDIVI